MKSVKTSLSCLFLFIPLLSSATINEKWLDLSSSIKSTELKFDCEGAMIGIKKTIFQPPRLELKDEHEDHIKVYGSRFSNNEFNFKSLAYGKLSLFRISDLNKRAAVEQLNRSYPKGDYSSINISKWSSKAMESIPDYPDSLNVVGGYIPPSIELRDIEPMIGISDFVKLFESKLEFDDEVYLKQYTSKRVMAYRFNPERLKEFTYAVMPTDSNYLKNRTETIRLHYNRLISNLKHSISFTDNLVKLGATGNKLRELKIDKSKKVLKLNALEKQLPLAIKYEKELAEKVKNYNAAISKWLDELIPVIVNVEINADEEYIKSRCVLMPAH